MNAVLSQLKQWPPTTSTVIGLGLVIFGIDYALTGNVVQATVLAGVFKVLCPEYAAAVDKIEGAGQIAAKQ